MLGKLLKYEMKASARTLLPLYIGTIGSGIGLRHSGYNAD